MADEEDEDLLDSWEEAIDSGELERRMEEREKDLKEKEKLQEKQEDTADMNSFAGPITILKAENVGRTEYTPQIKILKRNGNDGVKKDLPKQNTEAELKKTLKLREAEYQAARNRILGENYDEMKPKLENEEVKEIKISIIKPPTRPSPGSPIRLLTSSGNISPPQSSDNVIRQPLGPNDTAGFAINR